MVASMTSHKRRISCVYHPKASGVIETEHMGGIRTAYGKPAYQLATGEMIEIQR